MQNTFLSLPAIAISLDKHGNILAMSAQFTEWSMRQPQLGDNIAELLCDDLYLSLKEYIALALTGEICQCSVTRSNCLIDRRYQVSLCPSEEGCVILAQLCANPLRDAETQRIHDFLRVTFETIDQGITIYDENLQLVAWNQRYEQMDIFPKRIIAYGLHLIVAYRIIAEAGVFGHGDPEQLAQEHIEKIRTLQMVAIEDLYPPGRIVQIHRYYLSGGGICAIFTDVTEQRQLEKSLAHQASHDFLTGAVNRRYMLNHIDTLIQNHIANAPLTFYILFIDLDRFKQVNDILGHETGDKLLIACTDRINLLIDPKQGDLVARFGGDEFLLVVQNQEAQRDIHKFTKNLLEVIAQPYIIIHRHIYSSVSVGISQYPNDGLNSQDLIGKADMAMYQAKSKSRNNFHFYNTQLGETLKRNTLLINNMREDILQGGAFSLQYQPIISIESGEIVSAEALLRWNNNTLGAISPTEFIPYAEDSQQINPLGLFVIDQGLAFLRRINRTYPNFHLAINVSPLQLGQANFYSLLTQYIDKYAINPQNLTIEITESCIMQDRDEIKHNLFAIRQLGCSLAIDDFGTGYSSLSYVRKFPFTHIKIDQNFIQQIAINTEQATLVKAIIDMAKAFALKVVAEGIENQEQLKFLHAHDCTFAQGFYIDPPLDELEIINRLKKSVKYDFESPYFTLTDTVDPTLFT